MFYVKVGDKVRLREWARGQFLLVTGVGENQFLGKLNGVMAEIQYSLGNGWQEVKDQTLRVKFDTSLIGEEPVLLGSAVIENDTMIISFFQTGAVERFLSVLEDAESVMLSYEKSVQKIVGEPDTRPHSRACGIQVHEHGPFCAPDCPTCKAVPKVTLDPGYMEVKE